MVKCEKSFLMRMFFIFFAVLMVCPLAAAEKWEIRSPYHDANWKTDGQYKANLHAHTTMSDGKASPKAVIDGYSQLGYAILALTDHDTRGPVTPTWPWQDFGRSPEGLGMVAIKGGEISAHHHIVSYFNDYGDPEVDSEKTALAEIGRRGGLAALCHPGRYQKSAAWYSDLFRRYPHLIGFEIYNQGNRYPGDRKTWDEVLTAVIPDRCVWGFSNDDMHRPERDLGHNWNVMILPELSEDAVRKAMESGRFFFVYAPEGHDGHPPAKIQSITVDEDGGMIQIDGVGHERIVWISEGRIVHQGESVALSEILDLGTYIRAEIYTKDNGPVVGTQPFLVQKIKENVN